MAHADKVDSLMGKLGFKKGGDGFWADASGAKPNMKIYVPDWLKKYGPPLGKQLRDAGFDASFDTSPGLDTQVQTGEQALHFGCHRPAGVKGMDPYFMLSIFESQYYRPTGEPAPISWATSRYRNPEYDAVVDKISPLGVDDPKTLDYFSQAMDLWFKDLPMVYVSQLIIRYPMNTTYWTGWPSKDKPYGFPHSWQQELMKTLFALQPGTQVTSGSRCWSAATFCGNMERSSYAMRPCASSASSIAATLASTTLANGFVSSTRSLTNRSNSSSGRSSVTARKKRP
jgi:hypothetical protein